MSVRPESVFAGRRFLSPEDDPDVITCSVCGEDCFDRELCLNCANGEVREFPGRTAFPVRRAA